MTLQEIQSKINIYIKDSEYRDAYDLAFNIETTIQKNPQIKEKNPKEYKSLFNMILVLYTLGLKFVKKETFENLIKQNLVKILSITFKFKPEDSFIALIESKYSIYYEISRKNYIIDDCLPLVKECQDTLGNQYLKLSTDQPKENPTIKNWLEYYDRQTKIGMKSNFERSKFLSNDPYVMNLSNQDKDVLRNILYFYDYLHSPKLDYLDEEEKLFLKELEEENKNQESNNAYTINDSIQDISKPISEIITPEEVKKPEIKLPEIPKESLNIKDILAKVEAKETNKEILDKGILVKENKQDKIEEEAESKEIIKKEPYSKILDLKNNKFPSEDKKLLQITPKARKPIVLSMPKKIIPGNTVNLRDLKK